MNPIAMSQTPKLQNVLNQLDVKYSPTVNLEYNCETQWSKLDEFSRS